MNIFDRIKSAANGLWRKTGSTPAAHERAAHLIDEGNALENQGRMAEAMERYETAIRLAPTLARAYLNRGNVLSMTGDVAAALEAYSTALAHDPDYAAAHYNLGNAHLKSNRRELALSSYREAIRLNPNFADAEVALGAALEDLGQFDAAGACYRRALEINPMYAQVHGNLGNVLRGLGQFDAALACYRRALEIDPEYVDAHTNLGITLKEMGNLGPALASLRRSLEIDPHNTDARSALLFILNYTARSSAQSLLAEARHYEETVSRKATPYVGWDNAPDPERRLRVGLVSGDLRNHPVGYFLESIVTALPGSGSLGNLTLFGYSNHFHDDAITERIKSRCQGWRCVTALSDRDLAQAIREDHIDILVDLSGHTGHTRLPVFSWRAAPVQITWLGYFGTTGLRAIDYFIADHWTLPQASEADFVEKIWRLPETRLCFTAPEENAAVGPLPALGNDCITFGCFNHLAKMNDEVVALWAAVLSAVPNSRLFLKAQQINESVGQGILDRFARHGIEGERLILEGPVSRAAYFDAYNRVDIALDPFPYPGGTTTVEALWMGVPVITLAGHTFLSRQGVGLLMNAGLGEWVANSTEDYLALAISHAQDLQQLSLLRGRLRQQLLSSPVFDAPRFARHFESALRDMWREWCAPRTAAKIGTQPAPVITSAR